jgi:hypothetical protein
LSYADFYADSLTPIITKIIWIAMAMHYPHLI